MRERPLVGILRPGLAVDEIAREPEIRTAPRVFVAVKLLAPEPAVLAAEADAVQFAGLAYGDVHIEAQREFDLLFQNAAHDPLPVDHRRLEIGVFAVVVERQPDGGTAVEAAFDRRAHRPRIKHVHGGVGAINESDVILASASNAIIIGFNVRPDATAKEIADREGVDLRLYRVIYNAIEDVEAAMKGMLDPVFEEKVLGHAEVRQTFKASGVGTIAGSYVQDGTFERNCSVRLTRDGIVIFDGPLASLKRFKDDVKEVRAGYECGFVFENYNDIKEGDLVEAYKMVEIERK